MTIKYAHPRNSVDKWYLPCGEDGRGMIPVQQSVEEEKRPLAEYVEESREDILEKVNKEGVIKCNKVKEDYNEHKAKDRRQWRRNKAPQYLNIFKKILIIKNHGNG